MFCECFARAVKKMTGDWFYDQRFNRFSTAPGHGLVSHSLKRRSQCATSKEEVGVGANEECKRFSNLPATTIAVSSPVNFVLQSMFSCCFFRSKET